MNKRREYFREYFQRPDVKAKRREYHREYYQRPDVKARVREYHREYYQRPDVKVRKYSLGFLIDFFSDYDWHDIEEIMVYGDCRKSVVTKSLRGYVDIGLLKKDGKKYRVNRKSPFKIIIKKKLVRES